MPHVTFQEAVWALADGDAPGRGLRFCYGREAPTHAGVDLAWSRVAARVRALAARYVAAGLGAGDVVLVHAHDQQVALIAILAAIHLGAIPAAVAPIGAGAQERLVDQFHAIVAIAGARLLVADKAPPAECCAGRSALPPLLLVETFDERAGDVAPLRRAGVEDPCFLQFTSGSTSTPKGVVVTHGMLLANLAAITEVLGWGPQGRSVGWLPIYHDMSLVGIYGMLVLHRARGCLFPTARFGRSPDLWMQLMAEERADASAGPNFAYAMVGRLAERRPPAGIDLSCVRSLICGAEPIQPAVMRRFAEVHAPLGLREVFVPAYGMAECTLMATACRPGEPLRTLRVDRAGIERGAARPAADGPALELVDCGAPAPGMALLISRDDAAQGERGVGEILLAGDSVLTRYWRRDAAGDFLEHAGRRWLRTGDLGFLDGGRLFVCGRAKDVIIHNGVNHYPADVEAALVAQLPADVRIAAVVDLRAAIDEPFRGLGVLFEEAAKGGDPAAAEARVAGFVHAWTGLPVAIARAARGGHVPRTTSGKIVRDAVRAELRALAPPV